MARSYSRSYSRGSDPIPFVPGYEPGRLMLAVKYNDLNMARQVLESLPDRDARLLNVADDWGYTALHVAAEEDKADMCRFLIARNANIRIKDAFGSTALHHAASGGSKNVVDLLIARKAPLDVRNDTGNTALHLAASRGHIGIVEALVLAGADATAKNADGKTPLRLAKEGAQEPVATYLTGVEREQVHAVYKEINERKEDVIKAYILAQNEARHRVYRARVFTVTPPTKSATAGDSSLRKFLVGEPVAAESESTQTVHVDSTTYSIEANQYTLWEKKSPSEKKNEQNADQPPPSPKESLRPHQTRRDIYNVAIARFVVNEILKRAPIAKANVSQQDLKRKALEDPNWSKMTWHYEGEDDDDEEEEEKEEEEEEGNVNETNRGDDGEEDWLVVDEEEKEKKFSLPVDSTRIPEEVQNEVIAIWKEIKKSGTSEQLAAENPNAKPNIAVDVWDIRMNAVGQFAKVVWPIAFGHKAVYIMGYDQKKRWNAVVDAGGDGSSSTREFGSGRKVETDRNIDRFSGNLSSAVAQVPPYHYMPFRRRRRRRDDDDDPHVAPAFVLAGLNRPDDDEDDLILRSNLEMVQGRVADSAAARHLPDGGKFVFSLPSDEAEKKVRRYVEQTLRRESYCGERIPVQWLIFEYCVDVLKSQKKLAIARDELARLVLPKIAPTLDPSKRKMSDFDAMLGYYHDIGYLLHYDVPQLRDVVFLSPQWLFDFLDDVFSLNAAASKQSTSATRLYVNAAEATAIHLNGRILSSLTEQIANNYPIGIVVNDEDFTAIDLLEGLDFLVKINRDDDDDENEPACYIPLIASNDFQPPQAGINPCIIRGVIDFLGGYCPKSLFTYLAGVYLPRRYGLRRKGSIRFFDSSVCIQVRANAFFILEEEIDRICIVLICSIKDAAGGGGGGGGDDDDDDDDVVRSDAELRDLCHEINDAVLEELARVKERWIPGLLAECSVAQAAENYSQ